MKRTIAFLLSFIFLLFAAGCSSRSYDARELASIDVSGADGYGTLSLAIDEVRLKEVMDAEAEKIREDDTKRVESLIQREAALNSLIYTADKVSGLKNGDEVQIRVNFDEELAKAASVRFKNMKFIYKVDGLKEAAVIDVESDVDLVFTGYDGNGEAALLLSGETEKFKSGFDFTFIDGKTKLKNGDRVQLQVKADKVYLTSRGKIARDRVLTFEVKGLSPLEDADLFSNLVLVYDGISDQGMVSFDISRLPAEWVESGRPGGSPVRFQAEPSEGLSNGDQITVRAIVDADWLAERGFAARVTERKYSVSGLKEYPRNLDGVDLLPLFSKIDSFILKDLTLRLEQNYWNRDYRPGDPVSRWDYSYDGGVLRIYYGYEEANRAENYVAIFYKLSVQGSCLEADPYESVYDEADKVSATLYLVYIVDDIMYDQARADDFRALGLKLHGEVEIDVISRFKSQYGGDGIRIVEVPVPKGVSGITGGRFQSP